LKALCHCAGCSARPPMTAASRTKSSTPIAARWIPGRDCALPCLDALLLLPDHAVPRGLDGLLGEVTLLSSGSFGARGAGLGC
jgi:hypothetical protein